MAMILPWQPWILDNPDRQKLVPLYDIEFLKIITHPSFLNCLSVDLFVGTLYASFSGTNRDRVIIYLTSVCWNLMSKDEDIKEGALAVSPDMIKLLLNALYQLLLRVRCARFHDNLPALLALTQELNSKMTEKCSKADLNGLKSKIDVMRRLITNATRNLVTPRVYEENPQHTGSLLSSFPIDMQISGGRHDNDLVEIS
jgi:hypothetical protein